MGICERALARAAVHTCFAVALLFAGSIQAATLIGSEFGGQTFFDIDPTDGSAAVLLDQDGSPITTSRANGIAYDRLRDELVVRNRTLGLDFLSLDTGEVVLTLPDNNPDFPILTGLAFSPDQSILYSVGLGFSNGSSFSGLFGIDPTTGQSTFLSSAPVSCCGVAVRSDGVIITAGTANDFFSFDPNNNFQMTLLGSPAALEDGSGVTSLAFDENDVLFGIHTVPDSLVTIDLTNLSATVLGGDIGIDVRGLTFVDRPAPVPAPAAFPLLLGGIGILFGLRRMRRT